MHTMLLCGPISEPRLTEREKCTDAGGQAGFASHGFLHSTHSWEPVEMGEETNEREWIKPIRERRSRRREKHADLY